MIGPSLFLAYLIMDILFLNFTAATRLLLSEGIVATVTLYLVTTVYSLYLEMAAPPTIITDDVFDEEQIGESKTHVLKSSLILLSPVYDARVYGTTNRAFYIEETGPGTGAYSRPREELPPAYEELAASHKQHVNQN